MPNEFTNADALREYLSGAGSDGGAQTDPNASFGNYRSSTEAPSLGIVIANAVGGVTLTFAGGGNPIGAGLLTATDSSTLTWRPFGAVGAGTGVGFSGTQNKVLEASGQPGQYLRVTGTTPFSGGPATITLSELVNNAFGFDNVSSANALAGYNQYRATIVKNVSGGSVTLFKRWIGELGTQQLPTMAGSLGASGAGTIITGGTFIDWPETGWCHIKTSGGATRELIYYSSRTATVLAVPAAGRARLGTTAGAGAASDILHAVPGVAIAKDPDGVEAAGSSIQTIAGATTEPTGVTWNVGITEATGLSVGTLTAGQQIGMWLWREIPAGAKATPLMDVLLRESFTA